MPVRILVIVGVLIIIGFLAYSAMKKQQKKAKERAWKEHARKRARQQRDEWRAAVSQRNQEEESNSPSN